VTILLWPDQEHRSISSVYDPFRYDDNGNMATRGDQTITWDVENRPVTITGGASFVYDGDGNRGKKTEGGETILYINKYYEKNLTTSEVTTHYYLGSREVAQRKGTTLNYIHQDHLSSTSLATDSSGSQVGITIKYYPFGECRNSPQNCPTDKLFTGQRLDDTGFYYYGARYYDPTIGRFISADTVVPSPANPQALNRYSYCINNPLKYNDPTGQWPSWADIRNFAQTVWKGLKVAGSKVAEVYLSAEQLAGQVKVAAMRAVGIEYVTYYTDTNLMSEPVPVYHVGDKGIVSTALGNLSGISLYPIGTFVKESALSYDPNLPAHESYHYYEQSNQGTVPWLINYYAEIALDWAYYGGDYWSGPYNVNSREIAARQYAGQDKYIAPIPTPWWQEWLDYFIDTYYQYFNIPTSYYYPDTDNYT
jgi:RHS repeat-associated protein